MFKSLKYYGLLLLAAGTLAGCQRQTIVPEGQPEPGKRVYTGCIPQNPDHLPQMYITLPGETGVDDIVKELWTENCSVRIQATVDGVESTVFTAEGSKIKGRGTSTYNDYPKKPFTLKLQEQANFVGSGKTKRWVLLANWMDRTLLRNDFAFELARHTSLEWTPTGTFVDLFINEEYYGLYWLGERVHVEGSNFTCDYLYSYDTSDKEEHDFDTQYGHWKSATETGGIPVEIKFPDRDDYTAEEFYFVLQQAKRTLYGMEDALMKGDLPSSVLDMNTLCDFYIIQELCTNGEPRFPKSTYLYYKNNKIYSGPVWDFDYGTFVPERNTLMINSSLYYFHLWTHPEFRNHLKHRWSLLKPEFLKLTTYLDERAEFIRESEARNHEAWPCFPNPLATDPDGMVNGDEKMTFDQAVARMKTAFLDRIEVLDLEINRL